MSSARALGRSATKALVIVLALLLCVYGSAETFLITSDLHLTKDRPAHAATLGALKSAAEDADAVILLGDSTNNAHSEEHAFVLDFLASLDKPAYVIPGNHDITLDITDFTALYADYGWRRAFSRDETSASCAVLTQDGTCLMLLDTNDAPGYVAPLGGISDITSAWVSETLAALPEGTPVVACGHHPILPPERWARTPGADKLTEALKGVRLYLCGHDHGFSAVAMDGLQQITVGQPHVYPGWAGLLEVTDGAFHWRVLPLYDARTVEQMRASAVALGDGMARGTLKGTAYEGDEEAIQWFAGAFEAVMASQLTGKACETLLKAPGARKWRQIETKTVVKDWIFALLEKCPQDVREIDLE